MKNFVRFHGVRGSIPAPLKPSVVSAKIETLLAEFQEALQKYTNLTWQEFLAGQAFAKKSTYGGNTSCVEVRLGGEIIVLDMGSGARELGNKLMPEIFGNKGIAMTILVSHPHWDHIQGFPFFAPIYLNKARGLKVDIACFGGTDWTRDIEACLKIQMDNGAVFPVDWEKIKKLVYHLDGESVHDCKSIQIGAVRAFARELDHPQETYGWRLEHDGIVVAYTTDNEPRDPRDPYESLVELAKDADIWITDAQYTDHVYRGNYPGGVPRKGWGHSYPTAIAHTAMLANPKFVYLFHHDPASTDETIAEIALTTQRLITELGGTTKVAVASEELVIDLDQK